MQVVPSLASTTSKPPTTASTSRSWGTKLRKQQPISEIATQLDPDRFVRIHRAYAVNIERIKTIVVREG
jgi:DNA-binding LytR/AlgR family response regulator